MRSNTFVAGFATCLGGRIRSFLKHLTITEYSLDLFCKREYATEINYVNNELLPLKIHTGSYTL